MRANPTSQEIAQSMRDHAQQLLEVAELLDPVPGGRTRRAQVERDSHLGFIDESAGGFDADLNTEPGLTE